MTKLYSPPLFLLFFFCSFSGFSQHSIQGKVVDSGKQPVAFANLILLNAQDSTSVYRGAVSSEEGEFKFTDIEENEYLLKVSFVGFQDRLQKVQVSGDKKLGNLVLKEDTATLDEVSINYKNPSVKREIDRLVFSVENTTLSTGSSWDILKKTPGVILSGENLTVRNQGVQVYINDRKVQLTASELQTLLENYSAENIKSVEVITTPPARYDAEGGAVLNIVTSKSIAPGYKGNINAAWTQAIFPKYQIGTSHYYKTEKLNLFGNYAYSPRKEFKEDVSYINFMNNSGEVFSRWNSDFERTTRSEGHNANVMLDYELDDRNVLSFTSGLTYSPDKSSRNRAETRVDNGPAVDGLSNIQTASQLEEDLYNLAFDLEYRHQLKSEGQFSAKAHLTQFSQQKRQDVNTLIMMAFGETSENDFFTHADQDISIFTGQADYERPLGSINFETGLKASVIDSESRIDNFGDYPGGEEGTLQWDNFLYDERIYAAYFSLAKDWTKWSAKAGLRGEYTDRAGDSRSMEQVDERNYLELFPTFYLQHNINDNHSLTFDYSRRIQRPRYESLNPFRYYLNEFDYNAGNPDLEAAIINSYSLSYALKNAYFIDLFYTDSGNTPETLSFQDNQEMLIRRVSLNLEESSSYGIQFSHGRSLFNWWYTYVYFNAFNEKRTFRGIESGNVPVDIEIDGFFGSLYNNFIISKDGTFTGELTFTHVSKYLSGSYIMDPFTTLSIGFRKTLWNNRAELSVNFEDVLDETNTWLRSEYLNQDNGFFAQPESQYVRLGFKYNFGNFRLNDNQRAIEAAERDRL
ncbi:outer membrane beta-barrel protein [Salinimicrobium oceani]|uniref:TonB-dependent receptor n=1 Tax=Salinimicrobium oceani TaxID=2722702 RepID=A0ABX1D171_9FLAO|nr:outer membrane beta-barrel protein [Salinimicrobium oceani]NJW53812.1 TonB-dependent receptor [Salinimicrobium oceani]